MSSISEYYKKIKIGDCPPRGAGGILKYNLAKIHITEEIT